MTRIWALFVFAVIAAWGPGLSAQPLVPESRSVYEYDVDLTGTDLAQIFDTTLPACEAACIHTAGCEAFTFNQRSNACFPKRDITGKIPYEGGVSARIYRTDPAILANLDARVAELSFLEERDFDAARDLATQRSTRAREMTPTQRRVLESARAVDNAMEWISFGSAAAGPDSKIRDLALPALVNGYLRALDDYAQRYAAEEMAFALESDGRGRRSIDAFRLAQKLRYAPDTEEALEDAISKYGFRVVDTSVQSDTASPRICAIFNEGLIKAGQDYTPFVQLPDPQIVVSATGGQLCLDGVSHGQNYRFVLREGLPAASGETLIRDVELTLYVRDRAPSLHFAGRAYVLPRLGDVALPLETVNLDAVDLTLARVDDRNLMRAIQTGELQVTSLWGGESLSSRIGTEIWSGTAEVASELNVDTLTRIPLGEVLRDEPAGLYALTAVNPNDKDNSLATRQWFVLSDIGVATYLGADGLTVALRSLGDASAITNAEVTLISRSNAILGTAQTDAEGIARFEAGLTRGTGGNAPALVTAENGTDLTFLSLTDPGFDLSDRGVEGREPSPPMDVFLATDRGAYRAGDTIHATALMRDQSADALTGIPLTAVLTRPDGVEYARQTSTTDAAGGHVFALPVADTAPRGTWRVAVLADTEEAPLARTHVLVEDFMPERIDFDLSLPDGLRLGDIPQLSLTARYLFGAVGANLDIEGEALVQAADQLEAYPGYRFGQYDAPFESQNQYLDDAQTGDDGTATLPVSLPELRAQQPLTLTVTARVKEGSGRPVERQVSTTLLPNAPMIGIKPRFDGVVAEDSHASFDLIALTPDLTGADMKVRWTINKVTTRYQWYQLNGRWKWEPTTTRTRVDTGEATLGADPVQVGAGVSWGRHEIVVEALGKSGAIASDDFSAGWYAPASADDTPDLLEASLDAESYALGDTATFRVVPRYAGVAIVTVMSDRLITLKTVPVSEGENLIDLPVTEEWGTGAYVSASVIRPMSVAENRNPTRALGLGYAQVDPGRKALSVALTAPEKMQPRGPIEIGVDVDGLTGGETAYVTLAAVDLGILNLTGFESPDPQKHYFGQRKLGVELRDVYGRLIDGLNGALGTVRSGGDAMSGMQMQSPPPTEDLVTFFTGPVTLDANGEAQISFDLPAFNGTLRLMAIAWSETGVGQAAEDVIVRDPVVVTASVPHFLAPGDQSRMLLEVTHTDGPAGEMSIAVRADGLGVMAQLPATFDLPQGGKRVFEVPFAAFDVGQHSLDVTLTTPEGRELTKTLTIPVVVNDPEISLTHRFKLAPGKTFTFDDNVFDGLRAGTGTATLTAGPLARFDVAGLINMLDRYPYGCTEQITSAALPLLYLDDVARAMNLGSAHDIDARIETAIAEVTANQAANGAFGLWRPGSGDMWLDAYVTDFLTRARAAGYTVPDAAYDNALQNLRNGVNYYGDFDAGGTDLAYALFVLAREGKASVGDLRYYADQKSGSFDSPLAVAQLGAALAQYADQPRADRLFAQAGRMAWDRITSEERRHWRNDYGTHLRDAAGVLALAAEAGSKAVDRDALATRITGATDAPSTQEAVWTLLAANALIEDQRANGLLVNGASPDRPVVQIREDGSSAPPMTITNASDLPTELTLTKFGVPDKPLPAGGNGYAIERAYFTTEGEAAALVDVPVGTRLVTVLTVQPFGPQEARLMVNDPLPAGFEIDNPNLLSGGDIAALDWLDPVDAEMSQFRADRFLAAVDWRSENGFQLAYIVRAVSPGRFYHPQASVEDMYRPQMNARSDMGWVTIAE